MARLPAHNPPGCQPRGRRGAARRRCNSRLRETVPTGTPASRPSHEPVFPPEHPLHQRWRRRRPGRGRPRPGPGCPAAGAPGARRQRSGAARSGARRRESGHPEPAADRPGHAAEPAVLVRRQPHAPDRWRLDPADHPARARHLDQRWPASTCGSRPAGTRELHWHKESEWAYMLYGSARITAVDQQGRNFVDDVHEGICGSSRRAFRTRSRA